MLKTSFDENGTMVINADADIFIIPNHGCKVNDYIECFIERYKQYYENLCEINGKVFSEDDQLVQVWIASEDLDTENLFCHGAYIDNDAISLYHNKMVPKQLIDIKEGESTTLIFDAHARDINDRSNRKDVKLVLNITANQLSYRYRNHGKFEDVITKVCA